MNKNKHFNSAFIYASNVNSIIIEAGIKAHHSRYPILVGYNYNIGIFHIGKDIPKDNYIFVTKWDPWLVDEYTDIIIDDVGRYHDPDYPDRILDDWEMEPGIRDLVTDWVIEEEMKDNDIGIAGQNILKKI